MGRYAKPIMRGENFQGDVFRFEDKKPRTVAKPSAQIQIPSKVDLEQAVHFLESSLRKAQQQGYLVVKGTLNLYK